MILHALTAYYDRLLAEGDIQPPGSQEKEIPWVVVIDHDGCFIALIRTGDGKRGSRYPVPYEVKRTGKKFIANLLWDNLEYVFGVPRMDKKQAAKGANEKQEKQASEVAQRRQAFMDRLHSLPEDVRADAGVAAVIKFLETGDFTLLRASDGWGEMTGTNANVSFRLDGDNNLVCERPLIMPILAELAMSKYDPSDNDRQCLISGEMMRTLRLHPAIKGVEITKTGGKSSGVNFVAYDDDAYCSHGWKQGDNSSIAKRPAFAYVAALNHLLDSDKNSDNRGHYHVEGETTFVFWAAAKTVSEDTFAYLLGGLACEETESDGAEVREAFDSVRKGLRPLLDDTTPFYVLGLAPNAARLAVRFWREGTVGDMAAQILRHFEDLNIDGLCRKDQRPALSRLLGCAAIGRDTKKLQDKLRGNLAADIMAAILAGRPYPATLLARTIERCRSEQSFWPLRAALIKAALNRQIRILGTTEREVSVSLDSDNTNPGYLLGRLFAVLEHIQRSADPKINTTIRDSYFGAATTSPRAVFPGLMRLKNAHLKKLRRINVGYAIRYEKIIDQIIERLDGNIGFPAYLSLHDQGRFIIGYHHQSHDFYVKQPAETQPEVMEA